MRYDYVTEAGKTVSFDTLLDTTPILADGTPAMKLLDGLVERVGMRNVLRALVHICDHNAALSAQLPNHEHAKIWARWAVALEVVINKPVRA